MNYREQDLESAIRAIIQGYVRETDEDPGWRPNDDLIRAMEHAVLLVNLGVRFELVDNEES